MILVLIGHRGAGKTSLLHRLAKYSLDDGFAIPTFDLDQVIDDGEKKTISSIFSQYGESEFRRLEESYFQRLIDQVKTKPLGPWGYRGVISVGAGFQGQFTVDCWIVWIRRSTDATGRIFNNRPRLEPQFSPLDEYMHRYHKRERLYQTIRDEEWTVPEGACEPNTIEKRFFSNTLNNIGGELTLLPQDFDEKRRERFEIFLKKRKKWHIDHLELRTDLLSDDKISSTIKINDQESPPVNLLYSVRGGPMPLRRIVQERENLKFNLKIDWPYENKEAPDSDVEIISYHPQNDFASKEWPDLKVLETFSERCGGGKKILKFSPMLSDIEDIFKGHRWWLEDPRGRSFLPRSNDGRWRWYRLLQHKQMPLNFFREGEGSSPDQPLLSEWALRAQMANWKWGEAFGAVVGRPVHHSRTPFIQTMALQPRSIPVVAIRMEDDEFNLNNLLILRDMGLTWLAVTAPFKKQAFDLAEVRSEAAKEFEAANTLVFAEKVHAHNTDIDGFRETVEAYGLKQYKSIAIWGGGGTLAMIKSVLPHARCFASRTGLEKKIVKKESTFFADSLERQATSPFDFRPQALVWAIDRSRLNLWPSTLWKPQFVIDLNYSENSPGLEYAMRVGAKYISGLRMFEVQAKFQREFWLSTRQDKR